MNQKEIHINQNKNDCFFSIGDIVRGEFLNGGKFQGEITAIDIKIQKGKLHTCMDYKYRKKISLIELGFDEDKIVEKSFEDSVWLENVEKIEVLFFKGENKKKGCF